MVPREYSSGNRIQRGGITKTGNAHLRRVLVEAAWAYQHRPAISLKLRQRHQGLSEEVKAIAGKAQHRLHRRYCRLLAKGKPRPHVVTAVGRELPTVLITGDTSSTVRDLKADDRVRLVSKPIDAEQLLALLKTLLPA